MSDFVVELSALVTSDWQSTESIAKQMRPCRISERSHYLKTRKHLHHMKKKGFLEE